MRYGKRTAVPVVAVTMMSGAFLAACGDGRSVEAFCSTMDEHRTAFTSQMDTAMGQGFGGLFTAGSAVGDLKHMWSDLSEVAPEDIRQDVESVAEVWTKQEENGSSGNWMGGDDDGDLQLGVDDTGQPVRGRQLRRGVPDVTLRRMCGTAFSPRPLRRVGG